MLELIKKMAGFGLLTLSLFYLALRMF